jgi:Rod binding domain-containing protein
MEVAHPAHFLSRSASADQLSLDKLANNPLLSQEEKIVAVSRQFEAVLLRQYLSEAQKPLFDSSTSMGGASSAIYQDLVVGHLADEISKTGQLGLAHYFHSQLMSKHGKVQGEEEVNES